MDENSSDFSPTDSSAPEAPAPSIPFAPGTPGTGLLTPSQTAEYAQEAEQHDKYNKPLEAGAYGALRGATYDISDAIISQFPGQKEKLKALKEQNPTSSAVGETLGFIAPSILSGGSAVAAKTASKLASKIAVKETEHLLTKGAIGVAESEVANVASKAAKFAAESSGLKGIEATAAEQMAMSQALKDVRASVASAGVKVADVAAETETNNIISKTLNSTLFAPHSAVNYGRKEVEKLVEGAMSNMLKTSADKSLAKQILMRSMPHIAGGALEGAAIGTGDLLSEHALGNADLNAQNLLSHAGLGAILGGTASGVFGAVAHTFPHAQSWAKSTMTKYAGKYMDPVVNWTEMLSNSPSMREEFIKSGIAKKTLNLAHENNLISQFGDRESLVSGLKKLQTDSASKAEKILSDLHGEGFRTSSHALDSQFLRDVDTFKNANRIMANKTNAFQLLDGYEKRAVKSFEGENSPISIVDLKKLREVYNNHATSPKTKNTKAFWEGQVRSIDDRISTGLKDLEAVNPKYTGITDRYAKAVDARDALKQITSEAHATHLSSKRHGELSDLLAGGLGLHFGGSVGGVAMLQAKKMLSSDLRRRWVILSDVAKKNQLTESHIGDSVSRFLTGVGKKLSGASTMQLMNSNWIHLEKGEEKPKNDQQAFKIISNKITKLASDPEASAEELSRKYIRVMHAAPDTATNLMHVSQLAISFLDSKLPKDPNGQMPIKALEREWQPNSLDLAKFKRYLNAVEHPMNVFTDLSNGTPTLEQIETIKAVYPAIYEQLQQTVHDQLSSPKAKPLKFNKKLHLGRLLGMATDSSLQAETLLGLQANFKPSEDPQQPQSPQGAVKSTPSAISKSSTADRRKTDMETVGEA